MPKILEMINLNKTFGEGETRVEALKGINVSVEKGELVLIVGSSGSGKSTLLNMIGLLDRPTSGRILIGGTDTADLGDGEISSFRNRKLGFIFQFSNLLSDLTVLENVMLPAQIMGNPARERAVELLRAVGLEEQMYRRANKISGGQAQRAAIARGLINNPSIILADEPTGNLDSVSAGAVIQLIKSISKSTGLTFIIVTHDRAQFGEVDHTISIMDGRASEGREVVVS